MAYINAHPITPKLWLGNKLAALDHDFLISNKIDVVINCTKDIPMITDINSSPQLRNISFLRIPVDDSLKSEDIQKMQESFHTVLPHLYHQYFSENNNILVHCFAGQQRSAIVVAAFLYKYFDPKIWGGSGSKPLSKLFEYIRFKRPEAFAYGFYYNFLDSFNNFFDTSTFYS